MWHYINSTNGSDWTNNTNWLTGPVNIWYGISVINSEVIQVGLQNNNLTGSIPPEIGNLTKLSVLNLRYNQLSGSIPDGIGNLKLLYLLLINDNFFTGAIPYQIRNLTSLAHIFINNNEFYDLPSHSTLASLNTLSIENNKFTFEDIEPNVGIADNFIYSPQDSVGNRIDTNVCTGSYTFSIYVEGENNLYRWTKNGNYIGAISGDSTYEITSVEAKDAGTYLCEYDVDKNICIDLSNQPKGFYNIQLIGERLNITEIISLE